MQNTDDVTSIKGVGDTVASKLLVLGIRTNQDLIEYYPRRYDDYSNLTPIAKTKPGPVSIEATIKQVTGRYVRRGMHITEAVASDPSGSIRLVWFNQPYRANATKVGKSYFISGDFQLSRGRLSLMNAAMELASDFPVNTARIIPIYRETKGLKSAKIRKIVASARSLTEELPENLRPSVVVANKLMSKVDANSGNALP